MSIGFLIIATGKYTVFVDPLVESIKTYVLPGHEKKYHVFTDSEPWNDEYTFIKVAHEPWPGPTLHRFRHFLAAWEQLEGEQLCYVDADTLFVNPAGEEILGPRVAVQHCGFVAQQGTYETRRESMCYVSPGPGDKYYGGGFYSMNRQEARKAFETCNEMIEVDASRGIVPVWHDESAWNKYLHMSPPTTSLTPSYHWPENHQHIYSIWEAARVSFKPILMLIDKNHREMRS